MMTIEITLIMCLSCEVQILLQTMLCSGSVILRYLVYNKHAENRAIPGGRGKKIFSYPEFVKSFKNIFDFVCHKACVSWKIRLFGAEPHQVCSVTKCLPRFEPVTYCKSQYSNYAIWSLHATKINSELMMAVLPPFSRLKMCAIFNAFSWDKFPNLKEI